MVVPDFPSDKPLTLKIPDPSIAAVFGMTFEITGTPGNGDVVSVKPSASLFSALDSAIAGIRNASNNNGTIQAVGQALANIDVGMERVHNMRSYAGELMNRMTASPATRKNARFSSKATARERVGISI